ncbi:MAG TPA: alpha/beta hydrolase [Syntrophomonadaceae bacterium]|nr:alpha/beta hydrolase [Syntrophomonadaceae bacterium]
MDITIQAHSFFSKNQRCQGLFYSPQQAKPVPIIVMAHGFACQQDFALPFFAYRFAENGIGVFTFDYRHFGNSEGTPRQLISLKKQRQDWNAAVDYARTLPGIHPNQIILWGSSLSGGHVLEIAAERSDISLVLAHVPFTDGLSIFHLWKVWDILRIGGAGILDLLYAALGQSYKIPVVESPGRLGCMTMPGMKESYLAAVPEDTQWKNKTPARIGLSLVFDRPCRRAHKISCPTLIISGDDDNAVYTPAAQKTATAIKNSHFVSLPMGHCDAYIPGRFMDDVFELQLSFIRQHFPA